MEPCACGCGEPAVYAARHCSRRLRSRITDADYTVEDRGYKTPCWIVKGSRGDRYALIRIGGRDVYAHRAMHEQHIGPIPAGYVVDHLCLIPRCCRPSHLEAVTIAENTRRGRVAKLTLAEATAARESDESAREAGKRLGVSEFTIYQLRAGNTWN